MVHPASSSHPGRDRAHPGTVPAWVAFFAAMATAHLVVIAPLLGERFDRVVASLAGAGYTALAVAAARFPAGFRRR